MPELWKRRTDKCALQLLRSPLGWRYSLASGNEPTMVEKAAIMKRGNIQDGMLEYLMDIREQNLILILYHLLKFSFHELHFRSDSLKLE